MEEEGGQRLNSGLLDGTYAPARAVVATSTRRRRSSRTDLAAFDSTVEQRWLGTPASLGTQFKRLVANWWPNNEQKVRAEG